MNLIMNDAKATTITSGRYKLCQEYTCFENDDGTYQEPVLCKGVAEIDLENDILMTFPQYRDYYQVIKPITKKEREYIRNGIIYYKPLILVKKDDYWASKTLTREEYDALEIKIVPININQKLIGLRGKAHIYDEAISINEKNEQEKE